MPEAVIVSAARSPIGRANKGSLVDLRPDDLTATIVARLTSDPDSDKLIEASNAKAVACEKTSRK